MPSASKCVPVAVALVLTIAAAPVDLRGTQTGGLKIVVIEGEDAVNIIQQKTAVPPVVEVRDRNDLPIAGVPVIFTIGGGNTAAFAGGAKTLTVTTNAAGRAAASGLTPLSKGAVQIQVSATFQGQTATATLTQTNFVTAAQASQAANAGKGGTQAAAEGGGFPLKTVILLGAAGAGGYVAYDQYQKHQSSGTQCDSSLSGPGTLQSQIPAAGGTFAVTVEESCAFRVTTNVPWITLSVNSSQVFQPQTLTFTYSVAVNTGAARSGMINIELADGTGGSGFGVGQVGGTPKTFHGVIASLSAGAFGGDGLCMHTVALGGVTALMTRVERSILQAEVSVIETQTAAPGCPISKVASSRNTYVLQSGSISGQTVVMRFRATTSNSALSALSFSGTLSTDNRTINGSLTWHHNGAGIVSAPITFTAVE